MDINAAVGGKAGFSREKIEAALSIKESSTLAERERIALDYADRVSATPVDVPDEFFATPAAALLGTRGRRADGTYRARELPRQVEQPPAP